MTSHRITAIKRKIVILTVELAAAGEKLDEIGRRRILAPTGDEASQLAREAGRLVATFDKLGHRLRFARRLLARAQGDEGIR